MVAADAVVVVAPLLLRLRQLIMLTPPWPLLVGDDVVATSIGDDVAIAAVGDVAVTAFAFVVVGARCEVVGETSVVSRGGHTSCRLG